MTTRWKTSTAAAAILLGLAPLVHGQSAQGGAAPAARPDGPEAALAASVRAALLTSLPDPLFEDARKWGLKKAGPRGNMRNDGRWWKVRMTGRHLSNTLSFDVRDLRPQGQGRTTFTAVLAFDATVVLDRQTWKWGARLYSGSTRARMRVHLTLDCEATSRLEKGKTGLPDFVFRLRVVRSDLKYNKLVVEHTAGIGGDGAKVIGDVLVGTLRAVQPSLERDMLKKANAAILKAGDTREVRVQLADLLAGKKAVR